MLNETFLNDFIHPLSSLKHSFYNIIRLDRENEEGGGVLVYVRYEYIIRKTKILPSIEGIYLQIYFKKMCFNFLSCYKAPNRYINFYVHREQCLKNKIKLVS